MDEFSSRLKLGQAHVIGIIEAYCQDTGDSQIEISGFHLYRNDRKNGAGEAGGGGGLQYVDKSLLIYHPRFDLM